jgi:hypothetical protein
MVRRHLVLPCYYFNDWPLILEKCFEVVGNKVLLGIGPQHKSVSIHVGRGR